MIPVKIHSVATDSSQDRFYAVLASEEQQEKWLPLQIGASEAVSIASELNERGTERPGTHDLIQSIVERLGVTVDRVVIDRGEGSIEATIFLSSEGGDEITLEARPSDALAVGLRGDAELSVSEELMKQASRESSDFQEHFANAHPSSEVTQLQYELEQAVADENFEKAADLKQDIQSAARRYEESLDLDETITDELKEAYQGRDPSSEEEATDPDG